MREKMPRLALNQTKSENSDYTNFAEENRNCYLLFGAARNEDCSYSLNMLSCRSCADCTMVKECELCYECIDCENCYASSFLQNCKQATECAYCYDCINVHDCFGSVGLRNAEYVFFNEKLNKEEYMRRVEDARRMPAEEIRRRFEKIKLAAPRVYSRQINCEHCLGNYLVNCKNCFWIFDGKESQDCLYQERPFGAKDSVDCSNLYHGCELCYMVMSAINSTNVNFAYIANYCSDSEYILYCFNSHHLFGCVSRNRAEYQILNTKYEKSEYHKTVAEIKDRLKAEGSYGRMFESDFPLEDSIVRDYG